VGEGQGDNNAGRAVERVTIAQAAGLLGCHPNTVRSRVRGGMYRAEKVLAENGPTWMIERDSLTTNAPTAARQQDASGVSVVQHEDAEVKEWWQTRTGKGVGAAVLFFALLGSTAFISMRIGAVAWLISGILVAGLLAYGLYNIAADVAGLGTTGRDYAEPISEVERSHLLEEADEISKLVFEFFKHFTTLTTAAALVELALYQQLALTKASALLGIGALGLTLLLCIVGLVLLSIGTAIKGAFLRIGRLFRGLMVSTASLFLFGVVIFALAALSPTINSSILEFSHRLYELAKGMAQSIR